MNLTQFLPWLPILLGAGVGGRLLGRRRGTALGVLCALFWIVLIQASTGIGVWQHLWPAAAIIIGASAIVAMGAWAGNHGLPNPKPQTPDQDAPGSGVWGLGSDTLHPIPHTPYPNPYSPGGPGASGLDRLAVALDRFDDWLDESPATDGDAERWASFGEFIRSAMYECCRATHVKPYRLSPEGDHLVALREAEPLAPERHIPARAGIVGHVVTTGRSYYAGDRTQGQLVSTLAEGSEEPIAWCFAINRGTKRMGVVVVGRLDIAPQQNRALLTAVERLIALFWRAFDETIRARAGELYDPISSLETRPAFLDSARQAIDESYAAGEPVAAVVIALEGLRSLNDAGRWEAADELVREASTYLRGKVRKDDRIGRFDGSRFVLLLRRVDSELATLIVRQIIAKLTTICGDLARWRTAIHVRCGLAGSGTEQPDTRTLISRAMTEAQRARTEGLIIASDLPTLACAAETAP